MAKIFIQKKEEKKKKGKNVVKKNKLFRYFWVERIKHIT